MSIHFRRLRSAALCLTTAAVGCSKDTSPTGVSWQTGDAAGAVSFSKVEGPLSFTIGPLVLTGIEQEFPGHNWHLRDVDLAGPISGDLTGQANITLNANMDGVLGSGPAWGTVSLVTASGETWQGSLSGNFVSGLPEFGIQLFSRMVLHGPDQQLLTVECDETTATSETLVCTERT